MRKLFVRVCLIQLVFAGVLLAQSNRATVTGTVTDASGAIVPGATVSATNTATGVVTTAVSTSDGIYSIENLFPGRYSVEFKKDGFKTLNESGIVLESTQVAEINAKLQVGTVAESVTVSTEAPVLDTENESVGTNMNGNTVTDLPLSIYGGGRFVEDFAVALTPGYSPISSPYEAVINGNQGFTKDFTVDGTSATATIQGDSMEIGPSMEAVQELQATTTGLDPKSAITNGGVMAFNLKSGTNQFHGSAFGYGHNEFLDANTWDNGYTPDPNIPGSTTTPKAEARAWDYGGSLGGPIRKNKTFFFGTFERYTQQDFTPGNFSQTVPTTAMLGGDFSGLLGANLCSDPANTGANAGACGTADGTTGTFSNQIMVPNDAGQSVALQEGMIFDPATGNQFTGNKIPSGSLSSVSQKIIPLYQKYYAPEQAGLTNNNSLPASNSPSQTPNQAVVKIDENLTNNDRLSGSWIYNHRPRTLVDSGGVWEAGSTDGGPLAASRIQLVYSDEFRATESHTFTPNVVNVFNETYNWYWNGSEPTSVTSNWPNQLGFGNTGASNFPVVSFGSAVNGIGETSIGNSWSGNYIGDTLISGDDLTWTKGRHVFTFGGNFRAYEIDSHAASGTMNFNFLNSTTGAPSQPYSQYVGFGFASFLLGDAANAGEATPFNLYGRRKAMSLYAEDSYKIKSNLTINVGLRWDATFRLHEKYGHWANFNLNAIDPTLGIPGTLQFANGPSDSFERNQDWRNFGPQIGIAYSPWQKWVFRGAFGMTYVPIGTQWWEGIPYGFAPGFQGTNNATKPFQWDSGYPGVFQPGSKNVDVTQLFTVAAIDPNILKAGYTDNINFGAQYEVTPSMRLEAAYVGNRGHRLPDSSLAYNEAPASTFFGLINSGVSYNPYGNYVCNAAQAATFGVKYPYPGFCANVYAAIAPYPQLATLMDNDYYDQLYYVGLPLAQTYYDSMVIDLTKRYASGLTMDLNYTLSRQEGDTYTAFEETYGDYSSIQNPANLGEAAHTLTNYDQTHIVKGYAMYDLPFGNGQRWLSDKGHFANAVFGGWTVAGVVLYTSGQPFSVTTNDPYWPAWGNVYPDYTLSGYNGPIFKQFTPPSAGSPLPSTNFYMPTTVATAPPYGQLGTGSAVASELRCPGSANEDASLLKHFAMGPDGRYQIQARVEFYNLFNRHSYDVVGCGGTHANVGSSNFGEVVDGGAAAPRTGQFALRFQF